MNCENCQLNISQFLDNDLDAEASATVREHLASCSACAQIFEEFSAVLLSCKEMDADEVLPPNPQALWCRINNIIEKEARPEPIPDEPISWFRRQWNFSASQAGFAVLGVAIISSLLTIVGIRNYMEPADEDFTTRSAETQTTFEKVLVRVGLSDSPAQARERRIREQQAAIEYWNQRVQTRRAKWDERMRLAFDRNLLEIDQAVNEYTLIIEEDPFDEVSVEMLDTALNDKMNLLRQFSEL